MSGPLWEIMTGIWLTKSNCPRSRSVNDCLEYQRSLITEDNYNWLCQLPHFIIKDNLFMVHGGLYNPIDEYLVPSEEYFLPIDTKYFVSGHTHVQRVEVFNDKIYCNPGSVGQPRDNNPDAAFAVFDGHDSKLSEFPMILKESDILWIKLDFLAIIMDV